MKIAIIGLDARGLILFRLAFIEALVHAGFKVTAIFPDTSEVQSDVVLAGEKLEALGVKSCPLPMQRTGLNPLADLAYRHQIHAVLQEGKFDAVLSYGIKPIIHGLPVAAALGIPRLFAMVTGLGSAFIDVKSAKQQAVHWIARFGYKHAFSKASHIFFQNPQDQQDLAGMGLIGQTPSSIVAGSGVQLSAYPKAPLPALNQPLRFLFVGRLIKHKGVIEFLDAAQSLLASGKQAEFWVVGGEDPNPSGLKLAELKQDYPGIKFFGSVSNVPELLAQSHVFVLPSYREGTPRSALEAMATGRAVVVADTPGCRDVVDHQVSGFAVPVKDSSALAAAMQNYIDAPDLCASHGQAGYERAAAIYDVKKVNADIVETIKSLEVLS